MGGFQKEDINKTSNTTASTETSNKKDETKSQNVKVSEEEAIEKVKKISLDNNLLLLQKCIVSDKDITGTNELIGKYCYFFGYKGGNHIFYSYIVNSENGNVYECNYEAGDIPTIALTKN